MESDFTNDTLEKLFFKTVLNDKKWLNTLSNCFDERWFKVPYIGMMMKLTLKFYDKYEKIPSVEILKALAKKYAEKYSERNIDITSVCQLISEVMQFELNADQDVINENLKGFIKKNSFYNALMDNINILTEDPSGYEKVVDKCLENFDKVQKLTFNDVDLGLDYFDPIAMNKHWDYLRNPEAKIATMWRTLDEYTNGGFIKDGRSLYLIMAQAGLGKSVFLSNLAVNFLKQNLSVVVISLEMSEDVYAQRFDAHISKKNINKLMESEQTAIERIKAFYAEHPKSNLYIKEYPPKSVTCNDIQLYLENLKANGHSFDVVIVDYLNLVKSQHHTDNMFQDGLEVSEKLRALSYSFKVPVISAVQSNSEGMNNENIGMENLSQSRGIAFTTDFLMALFQTPESRENGLISARILKNRLGGRVGTCLSFSLDSETLTLADVTGDPDISFENNNSEISKITGNLKDINQEMMSI